MPTRFPRLPAVLVILTLCVALFAGLPQSGAANRVNKDVPEGMQAYQSPYYDLYSDLEPERVQEALLRMTRMAEEYHERTKEFSGIIRNKFPFYLFKNASDYYAAGGMAGSAGEVMVRGTEDKLHANAGGESTHSTWHIVQHHGVHQFPHQGIRRQLAPWPYAEC